MEVMAFPLTLGVISFLCFASTMVLAISLSLPGCQEKCGNVTIPYPFGVGCECSANSSFTVICEFGNSTNHPTPFLSSINMEIVKISLYGTITVNQPVSPVNCSDVQTMESLPETYWRTPFMISAHYNSLVVLGCKNSVWLRANESTVEGCTPMCDANSTDSTCNGVNCCQTPIPARLKELDYAYRTTEASSNNNSFCGYVFPVDKEWFEGDFKRYKGLFTNPSNPFDPDFGFVPLVLEWEFGEDKGYSDGVCSYSVDDCLSYPNGSGCREAIPTESCERRLSRDFCNLYPLKYRCQNNYTFDVNPIDYLYDTMYINYGDQYDRVSWKKYCSCPHGYEGNPYLPEGCIDINECSNQALNPCGSDHCTNVKGDYTCQHEYSDTRATHIIYIGIGSLILLLVVAVNSTKAITRRIKANRRRKFFNRNGGLLLEQQLSASDNGLEKTKLYTSKELTYATQNFNENLILGRGGQGTVYKGMLMDGKIVAVKKSQKVEEDDLEVFINEVVILSQVNHRNVVKLLGCCLETEVPLLVYEFVPNGTLLQQIQEPNEEFPLTWEMRVRIAREVAGALAYLHSSASAPIYHRDIKSTNILLDDKYHAKISDFGTSRSIAIDQTHLTTRVQGTFGYFDPEYFQSSQFTDKSDVYSFGVVMVELLTGEKAISSLRLESGRNLATHFVHSMKENQLFEILDARVLEEGRKEEIVVVAELARRCLHSIGKRRPTMNEIAVELEAIQMMNAGWHNVAQNEDEEGEWNADCYDFSTISGTGSMHFSPNEP